MSRRNIAASPNRCRSFRKLLNSRSEKLRPAGIFAHRYQRHSSCWERRAGHCISLPATSKIRAVFSTLPSLAAGIICGNGGLLSADDVRAARRCWKLRNPAARLRRLSISTWLGWRSSLPIYSRTDLAKVERSAISMERIERGMTYPHVPFRRGVADRRLPTRHGISAVNYSRCRFSFPCGTAMPR